MTRRQRMPEPEVPTDAHRESDAVHRFTAIGTRWQIVTEHPLPSPLRADITALAEDFDRVWSRFRPDSLVTEIAQHQRGDGY